MIVSSVNKDSIISSFLNWMPFISFSCLISLSSTASIMPKRSGEEVVLALIDPQVPFYYLCCPSGLFAMPCACHTFTTSTFCHHHFLCVKHLPLINFKQMKSCSFFKIQPKKLSLFVPAQSTHCLYP